MYTTCVYDIVLRFVLQILMYSNIVKSKKDLEVSFEFHRFISQLMHFTKVAKRFGKTKFDM